MAATQTTYVAQAQTVQSLANQMLLLYNQIRSINSETTNNGAQNGWKAMATAVQNADGSIGAADGAPNNAHPITVGTPPLNMAANDLINALNILILVSQVLDGSGSATVTNRLGSLANIATTSS